MWEQMERYRNQFLQREIKDVMKPSSINSQQNKGKYWDRFKELLLKKYNPRVG